MMDLGPLSQSAMFELKTCLNLSHVQRHVAQFEREEHWSVLGSVQWVP